jgi:hypothetical protein
MHIPTGRFLRWPDGFPRSQSVALFATLRKKTGRAGWEMGAA